ncbi:TIGR02444 family protein [Parvularcula oceani]|uniref:TIGR02444 family protein n=1 Tax=Parvularcula oceani TaxID=1247963 RepID=UPI00138E1C91|nr:TIGR02444 family protein [Parvularcula oceani]
MSEQISASAPRQAGVQLHDRFWTWSTALLRDAEARRVSLALQDRYSINANVALWCVWTAHSGYVLEEEEARRILDHIEPMDAYVVRRLREVRRYLSAPHPGYPLVELVRLRRETYEAELAGERLVQLRLEAATRMLAGPPGLRGGAEAGHEARRLFSISRAHLEMPVVLADDLGPESPVALFETLLDRARSTRSGPQTLAQDAE